MDISVMVIILLLIALAVVAFMLLTKYGQIEQAQKRYNQLSSHLKDRELDLHELQKTSQRIQQVLNALNTPVLIADAQNQLIQHNSAANQAISELNHLLGSQIAAKAGSSVAPLSRVSNQNIQLNGLMYHVQHLTHNDDHIYTLLPQAQANQMADVVTCTLEALQNGDLDRARIDTTQMSGDDLVIANKINAALQPIEQLIRDTGYYLGMQANAKLDEAPKVTLNGALGQLQFAQNLSLSNTASFVTEVDTKAKRIINNMYELDGNVQNVSDRVQSQAAAIAEIASATQNISERARTLDEQMLRMTEEADTTATQLTSAEQAIVKAGSAMNDIQEKSRKIEEIVGLIDGIAFQTNLLALNAAVEAARAGEHGRGFAVVAGEVRALAGKSAEAAKNIKELIEETINDIRVGGQVFSRASEAIGDMNQSVAGLTNSISDMRIDVSDTAKGVDEINKGIDLLDNSLQQIAALVEETAAASSETISTATNLGSAVGMFSTGLMTQLLASARRADDFRFATGRRAVRLWSMHVAGSILGMENSNLTNQDPLSQWRSTVTDANLGNINTAMNKLMQTAQKLYADKDNLDIHEHMEALYSATRDVTDAITAEETSSLGGGGGYSRPSLAAPAATRTAPAAAKRPSAGLPAPSKNSDEWEDF